ncbi:MAG: acyl-CoA dehydrogenase family protein [Rhodospirillaceae bacterium]|nr:acyl-CoA dehydrogenase family protein [Rhodospirillaceae bacterium]
MAEAAEVAHRIVPDADTLLQRAEALRPDLRARAAECERLRMAPPESIRALKEAGLFRILQPRQFGGYELDFATLIRLVPAIARGCGSTGWVYMIASIHQWLAASFSEEAQREIWGDETDTLVSGSYAPAATAQPVPGGFRVSGTWAFASGCDHAGWHVAGVIFPPEQEGAKPSAGFVLLPRADYRIEDNWHTIGLAGTGSKNIAIDDAFVPAYRTVKFEQLSSGTAPGVAVNRNSLYRIPFLAAFPACLASTAIGIAEDAIDEFLDMARVRTTRGAVAGGGNAMAQFHTVQSRLGEATASVDAARLLLNRCVVEAAAQAATGETVSVAMRIRNRRDHAFAAHLCAKAVEALHSCTGGAGLFLASRIQRAWRDANGVAKHIALNWDAVSAMYGQHALGLEPKGQY